MKAKDLMGKNIEDLDSDSEEPKQSSSAEATGDKEDDQVAAAYENISKKLSSLRGGDSADSDESEGSKESKVSDEVELEEWKGPKPPSKEEVGSVADEDDKRSDDLKQSLRSDDLKQSLRSDDLEEDHDLRKVKLQNLEDEHGDEEKSKDDDSDHEEADAPVKKDWKPAADDPLDEDGDDLKQGLPPSEIKEVEDEEVEKDVELDSEDEKPMRREMREEEEIEDTPVKNSEPEGHQDAEAVHSEVTAVSNESEMEEDLAPKGPDTLDDLADESPFAKNREAEGERPVHASAGEEDKQSLRSDDLEYAIPNLKSSRQTGGEMGYNAPSQREGLGQSYAPRGNNMDGNDPNNFFSQHQPQPAKRANKFHLLVLVIIGVVVIGFTVYILKGGFGDIKIGTATPSPSPSATATPEPTPTPTPEPEVDRGAFTVRVLNGTSTSGLAGKIRDKMKELGYKTATPGNAADSDVEQTEIRVKEGSESASLVSRLILDLAPDYEAKEGEKLDDKVAYDAEVIIGAK